MAFSGGNEKFPPPKDDIGKEVPETRNKEGIESEDDLVKSVSGNEQNTDIEPHVANRSSDLERATTQTSYGHQEQPTRIVTAVDWTGPDDPGNPMNWPIGKRAYHTAATATLALAVTVGTALISPSTDEIAAHFGVSRTASILPLSLFVVGLASGPIVAAPISETYGRSIVYKVSGFVYMLFLLGSGFSKTFGSLLVCRLFAGIAGSPVLAVGAGTNADMYPLHLRAIPTSYYILMPFLGTAVAPVIGGFAAQFKGWRWTQWCTLFMAIAAYLFILPTKETYKKILLRRRAKTHHVEGPQVSPASRLAYVKILLTITLLRPLLMIVREPIVFFMSLYSSFTFGVLFGFLAAFPYVFGKVYHFNTWQSGLAFLGIMMGVILAGLLAFVVDRTVYKRKYDQVVRQGQTMVPPEHRLYCAMLGAVCLPIGLFWFAWTARPDIHWISPLLAGLPFGFGNLAIFISAALYLVDVYGPLNGASAMAANGLMRYSLGAAFPLFTIQMYEALTIPWATSLLAFISVVMMPIPWVFFKYGPIIRAKSHYETVKF